MGSKELPAGWKWATLGEICNKPEYGYTTSAKPKGSGPKFLRTTDISEGEVNWTTVPFCKDSPDNEGKYLLKDGDILISRAGSVGESIVIKDPPRAVFASYLIRFQPKQELDPTYAGYYLKSDLFRAQLALRSSGTTLKGVNASNLSKIKIPLPPLEVQHRIVAILGKAEATQRLRGEADALTRSLSESAFINLFGNPLENRFGWKIKRLEDVSEIVSGVTKGRKFKDQMTIWVPYLRVANVQDGYLDLAEIKEIEVLESDVDKYALNPGDVLLTEGGDRDKLGRGAVWNGEVPLCLHQNHIFRVRVNPEFLTPEYLSMLTGSTYGKTYFLKSAKQTTGIASINSTQLKNFPTFLPPLELQYEFSEFVKRVEEVKRKQGGSKQKITMLFESLANNAFSGEMTA